MKIVVTHDELERLTNELLKESSDLNTEINKLLSSTERLGNAWEGQDKDVFTANSTNYFIHMKDIVKSLDEFAKFAKLSNDEYYEKDEEWQKNLEKANAEFSKGEKRLEN